MKKIITCFLLFGCILCFISCSKEKKWIKHELPERLWDENITFKILEECDELDIKCMAQVDDTLQKIRQNYKEASDNLTLFNAMGGSRLMSALGATHSALQKELDGKIQSIIEPINIRCDIVKGKMDGLRHLKDSSLVEQQVDYDQLSRALVYNEDCVDSVARCLMTKLLLSTPKPEIKQIKKKNDVWIVDFKTDKTQYVTFSENFSGELIPTYSPYISDDGQIIPVDGISLY